MSDTIERMRALYEAMDSAYGAVASHYGFGCEGCAENCCTQRFFHYTLAERQYLLEGLRRTDPGLLRQMLTRARVVTDSYMKEIEMGLAMPLMCPANFGGLCRVYEHRPMICRMHGMPHTVRMPDGRETASGGCSRFEAERETVERMDRTPLYAELAAIERDLRQGTGFGGRYRKTTAQMLMEMFESEGFLREMMQEAE